jgi:DNA-binding response OmpR family regulator
MRILVVEDDRKVAGFIAQGLREEGHAVDVAEDGMEATGRTAFRWPRSSDGKDATPRS